MWRTVTGRWPMAWTYGAAVVEVVEGEVVDVVDVDVVDVEVDDVEVVDVEVDDVDELVVELLPVDVLVEPPVVEVVDEPVVEVVVGWPESAAVVVAGSSVDDVVVEDMGIVVDVVGEPAVDPDVTSTT